MKPLLLIILPLLALVGCQTLEQEIVLPGVDESPPAVLLGHVPGGLPADFYEDAAEVTGQAVLRYVALSDQITAEGGVNPQSRCDSPRSPTPGVLAMGQPGWIAHRVRPGGRVSSV